MKSLRWLFSARHYEIKIVLATLSVLITLPIVSVVVAASSATIVVSDALAAINPITHVVEIFTPDGDKLADLELSTVWPTRGYVSDEFGTHQPWRRALGLGPHTGIDIANAFGLIGDPITPFLPGKVVKVDYDGGGDCGIYVKVQHEHNITSLYCHLSLALAVEQQEVQPGAILGLMGSTGESTGPHLHFMVAVYDIPVNPRTFLVGEPERSLLDNVLDVVR
jgi:murein DD-endopeptidase MepM/ murein hydrolase activator NlpD